MDPMAIQGAASTGWTRAGNSSGADVYVALREGRTFAGDVLQTLDGGSVLIGVGALRVPAKSQTELQPGRRYLFEIVHAGDPIELRQIGEAPAVDTGLVRALRAALGAQAPLGALLQELAHVLGRLAKRDRRSSRDGDEAEQLLRQVEQHAYSPDEGPQELRAKLVRSGLSFEGRLAQLALDAAPWWERARIGGRLIDELVELAERNGSSAGLPPAGLRRRWSESLRQVFAPPGSKHSPEVGYEAWLNDERSAPAPRRPAGVLALALERLPDLDRRSLEASLAAQDWERWPRWMKSLVLEVLAGFADRPAPPASEAAKLLVDDLKAQLLHAVGASADGELHAALEHALAGLDADQLVNVARSSVDEPLQWSVPVHDGEGWTTLTVRVAPEQTSSGRGADEPSHRVSLEIEFARTGALHVDLLVSQRDATVRVLVADHSVCAHFGERASELQAALTTEQRTARVLVALAPTPAALHVDEPAASTFFEGGRLLDLEG